MKAAAGLQPEPIKSMLENLADAGATQGRAAERQGLTAELKPITDFCARTIAGRNSAWPSAKPCGAVWVTATRAMALKP